MKFIRNILVVLWLLLQTGAGFAVDPKQAEAILENVKRFKNQPKPDYDWEHDGPTLEDIKAATEVKNLAAKGSREDKLITAVKNGDLKNVEKLIAARAGLEARNPENMTVLMIAAKKGYTDIASKLIKAGADINAGDAYGRTALFYAVDTDHAEVVKLLIANGAAKNEKNFRDIFVAAAFKGHNETMKALLAEGACIDHDTLETAYGFARTNCSSEIVDAIKEVLKKFHN